MSEFIVGLSQLPLPNFTVVRQDFPAARVTDVVGQVRQSLAAPEVVARLQRGIRVALAVGSRGIAQIALIVTTLVDELTARGIEVFIVPAMGSHGGATAPGQSEVLARLGIDQAHVHAPVHSAMETVVIGHLRFDARSGAYVAVHTVDPAGDDSVAVHMDKIAFDQADIIIPVVRIKPHTGFHGSYESGICKMLAIGLGKHQGCSRMHREGYARFPALLPAAAALSLATGKVLGALCVVENAAERIAHLELVLSARIMAREPELLDRARALMPRLLLPRIDVLVIEQFGKDISGVGMDPNITGRSESGQLAGFAGPRIARIVVLGLTAATHGNATGLGHADIITERVFSAIDRHATAVNVLTSGSLGGGRIPLAAGDERTAILAAMQCVPGVPWQQVGIVRIRSTMHLTRIAVSDQLLDQVRATPGCHLEGRFSGSWADEQGGSLVV